MSLTAYLVGAWLTACIVGPYSTTPCVTTHDRVISAVATALVTVMWPAVCVLQAGALIRIWARR